MNDNNFEKRLDALGKKLKQVEARNERKAVQDGVAQKLDNMGLAYRMMVDLIAGVILGLIIGLGIDKLFATAPFGLIIMMLLGLVAGIRVMLQSAKKYELQQKVEDSNG